MRRSSSALLATLLLAASQLHAANLKPGLVGEYFKQRYNDIPKGAKPFYVRVDKQVDFREVSGEFYGTKLSQNFTVRWTGQLLVEQSGQYGFATASDDGSRLYIDGKLVVDNGGSHSWAKKSGKVQLTFGTHEFELRFDQGGGGAGCIAYWTPPGGKEAAIPAKALFHKPESAGISWDRKSWENIRKAPARKPAQASGGGNIPANYGNFIGTAVRIGRDEHGDNIAFRANVIRLNEDA